MRLGAVLATSKVLGDSIALPRHKAALYQLWTRGNVSGFKFHVRIPISGSASVNMPSWETPVTSTGSGVATRFCTQAHYKLGHGATNYPRFFNSSTAADAAYEVCYMEKFEPYIVRCCRQH